MKNIFLFGLLTITFGSQVLLYAYEKPQKADKQSVGLASDTAKIIVPLGGNAWITKKNNGAAETITNNGLRNWTSAASVTSIYFRAEKPGDVNLSLRMKVPEGKSTFKVSAEGKSYTITASNTTYADVNVGKILVAKAGYIKVDIQGVRKTGGIFGEVSDLMLNGAAADGAVFTIDNKDNYFHWGRRGPSVHLRYTLPDEVKDNIEWFYNEITVPQGEDKEGSYYMANGFSEGYFGMQVNSKTERHILFSIWSPFTTDDPNSIPDSLKIKLLKKGEDVKTTAFGGEGSGGQSYLIYPWKAGKTYVFLTHAKPDSASRTTVFTSYFKESTEKTWKLIASFRRPKTNTNLKSLYSFLENFNPEMGFIGRKGMYGNQWIRSTAGKWYELTGATFTADATARKNYRKDYAGGSAGKNFYLRNCGFFADFTPMDTKLQRTSSGKGEPIIDTTKLP